MFWRKAPTSGASGRMAPSPTTAMARCAVSSMGILPKFVSGAGRWSAPVQRVGGAIQIGEQTSLGTLDRGHADARRNAGSIAAVVLRAAEPAYAIGGHLQGRLAGEDPTEARSRPRVETPIGPRIEPVARRRAARGTGGALGVRD